MQEEYLKLDVDRQAAVQLERLRTVLKELPQAPHELCMAIYPSDTALRRCTGEPISAAKHRAVLEKVAADVRSDGLTVHLVMVEPDAYFAWLGSRENTAATRSEYAGLLTDGDDN